MTVPERATHILVVDDEEQIRRALKSILSTRGYTLDMAATGEDALIKAIDSPPDLVVLDLMLPDRSGIEVCRELRTWMTAPILILSVRSNEADKITALDEGADDYLTKPFSPKELLARIRAVLRRRAPQALDDAVLVGALRLDPATRRVTWEDAEDPREVKLGPTEFRLLHFLMTHPERVHSRAQLLDRVWGDHVFIEERTVDVHIKRLREALAPVHCTGLVETVRGSGYRLVRPTGAGPLSGVQGNAPLASGSVAV
jgi:two-component system phosphate regulon response regulator PhoB